MRAFFYLCEGHFLQNDGFLFKMEDIFLQLEDFFKNVPTLLGIALPELEVAHPREAARQQFR
jgi:hypothetical protein